MSVYSYGRRSTTQNHMLDKENYHFVWDGECIISIGVFILELIILMIMVKFYDYG